MLFSTCGFISCPALLCDFVYHMLCVLCCFFSIVYYVAFLVLCIMLLSVYGMVCCCFQHVVLCGLICYVYFFGVFI